MPDPLDHLLPTGADGDDPWALHPEPTTLVALWAGGEPPPRRAVLAALEDPEVVDDAPPVSGAAPLWSAVVALPGREPPAIVWAEPAAALPPAELDDARASRCRWIVGIETLLEPQRPLESLTALLGLLAGAVEDTPALLDVNSGRWHPWAELRQLAGGTAPPQDVLWALHVVEPRDERGAWLHTHGLRRCGRPELEMLDVPSRDVAAAAELISALAGRWLEETFPPAGRRFPAGAGLEVTLQTWRPAAAAVGDAPGGPADRGADDEAHAGARAVVCAPEPAGVYKEVWTYPREALRRLAEGRGALLVSSCETARQAAAARAAWPRFRSAFAALAAQRRSEAPVRFLFKSGLADAAGNREHVWFAVRRLEAGRAEGELLDRPAAAAMRPGERAWIPLDRISDWSVVTPLGAFGPDDGHALEAATRTLRAAAGTLP